MHCCHFSVTTHKRAEVCLVLFRLMCAVSESHWQEVGEMLVLPLSSITCTALRTLMYALLFIIDRLIGSLQPKPLASFISRRRSLTNKHASSTGSSGSAPPQYAESTNDKITFPQFLLCIVELCWSIHTEATRVSREDVSENPKT